MHLDLDQTTALAIFAAAAFDIEAKPAGIVTAHTRGGKLGKQFANRRERSSVSNRIRTRRATDRALIDHDRLVDLIEPAQRAIFSRFFFRVIKITEERTPQNVVDQSGFAAA